jgi:hypothetical protein
VGQRLYSYFTLALHHSTRSVVCRAITPVAVSTARAKASLFNEPINPPRIALPAAVAIIDSAAFARTWISLKSSVEAIFHFFTHGSLALFLKSLRSPEATPVADWSMAKRMVFGALKIYVVRIGWKQKGGFSGWNGFYFA